MSPKQVQTIKLVKPTDQHPIQPCGISITNSCLPTNNQTNIPKLLIEQRYMFLELRNNCGFQNKNSLWSMIFVYYSSDFLWSEMNPHFFGYSLYVHILYFNFKCYKRHDFNHTVIYLQVLKTIILVKNGFLTLKRANKNANNFYYFNAH